MSNLVPTQFFDAQKAGLDSIFGLLMKSFEVVEKLVELNLQAVKATLAENQDIAAKATSTKDLAELFALSSSQAQPVAEKVQSYWQHVSEILSSAQDELASAVDTHLKQYNHDAQGFIDGIIKNAPAGGEAALSAWKSALTLTGETVGATYDAAKKAAKQAVEIADSHANVGAASANGAVKRAVAAQEKAPEITPTV